jgi:5,10-methylenetetrahydromethanopterin reductase
MTMPPLDQLSAYILPGGVKDPRKGVEEARTAEEIGVGGVWLGERLDTKDFPAILGACSQVTRRIQLGVGITPMNLRHPMVLASAGQTLQALAEGRFRFGFGRSADWRWQGYGYAAPTLASMRDVAGILRRLWAGETVSYEGPAGSFPNIRLPQITGREPPPLYLAAVGAKTLALAGSSFDGVILHPFLTVEAVAESARIVRAAAAGAGRDPAVVRVVATVVSAPDLSPQDAALAIHARGAGYFQVNGLGDALVAANGWDAARLQAYRNDPRLLALGGKTADKHMSRAELIELTEVLPSHWIPSSSASGTSAEVVAVYRRYLTAGADEVLTHGVTVEDLSGVARAFREGQAA